MIKYRFVEGPTSDVMFEAYGKTSKELFENSALALSEVICKIKQVKPKNKIKVQVRAESLRELLFNWLQEIIAQVDINEMFFSKFKITKITDTTLTAELYGQPIQPELGETVVKAITRHNFTLKTPKETKNHTHKAVVVMDI
ncbi:MAG: archease [Nanoarchaeota archaeon]|nr:archease [Nanoarchaeota archaeon]